MSISFSKKRWEQIITFLGILGFVLCLFLSSRVFPSAAIDLSIPRSMIRQEAIAYMETIEPEISSYETTQRSSSSGFSSIYLQKTIGIPETSRRISEEQLPIYYWDHRYFRPQQQEEFDLELSPQGEVIGYYHTIADTIEGEDLSEEKAQAIAEDYLSQERQWDLADWELIDSSSVLQQSDRRDHTFGWKSKKFAVGEAELRLSVTVQGDQIGGYNYFIKVPQEFSRDFEEDQNLAYFFTRISYLVGYYSSLAVAFLFFIVAIAQGKINWKKGLWLPAIVGVVYLATSFNSLILSKSWYWTTENYTLFWLERIFYIFFNLSMVVVPIYFLWMGGQQLIKKVWPSEDKALPRGLNRWRIFNRSYWRGLMATGIGLGAVNIFYWIAINYFSAWSPMGVDYSNFFATPFPFLSPLASGVLPSVSEELVSRFVGITLIYWLFRSRFLALLIPGAIWATAHLAYVRDPFYLRGLTTRTKKRGRG